MAMILDTNALSAFFDGDKELLEIIASAQSLHLPVIVLGEYRFGLKGSKLRKEREPILLAFAKTCTVLPVLESTRFRTPIEIVKRIDFYLTGEQKVTYRCQLLGKQSWMWIRSVSITASRAVSVVLFCADWLTIPGSITSTVADGSGIV
jgi:hypothetical protein